VDARFSKEDDITKKIIAPTIPFTGKDGIKDALQVAKDDIRKQQREKEERN